MTFRRFAFHACLLITLAVVAGRVQADPPINESGNFTTVTVNAGQTVTSANATPAITLGGGAIDNSGTVENTANGTAILVEDGAEVINQASGLITGDLVFQGDSFARSSIQNAGTVNGTAQFNVNQNAGAFVSNTGSFTGDNDLAVQIFGVSNDSVSIDGGSVAGEILMGGAFGDDDDDDDEDSVFVASGATLTTVSAQTAITMGSGRVTNNGTITGGNDAVLFGDTGNDGNRRAVFNEGTITAQNGRGIADDSGTSIGTEIFNGGTIEGTGLGIHVSRSFNPFQATASVLVDNSEILGAQIIRGSSAVLITGNVEARIFSDGLIEGLSGTGVVVSSQANDFVAHQIGNDGTITGTFGGDGVSVFHSTIDGDDDDDDAVNGTLSVDNSGSISGDTGVRAGGNLAVSVINSGAINGNGFGTLLGDDDDDDDDGGRGVFIETIGEHNVLEHEVRNSGLIEGNTAGVQVLANGPDNSSVLVRNGGEIQPTDIEVPTIRGGVGVFLDGNLNTNIQNFGIIQGGDDDDDDDDDNGILTGVGVGVISNSLAESTHVLTNRGQITGESVGAGFLSSENLLFDQFAVGGEAKMIVTVRNGSVIQEDSLEPQLLSESLISGGQFGLAFAGNVDATVTNATDGVIKGFVSGVGIFSNGNEAHTHSIDNAGEIASEAGPAIEVQDISSGAGASLLRMTNSGLIEGSTGLDVSGNIVLDLNNSGTIRTGDSFFPLALGDDDDDDDAIVIDTGSPFELSHSIVNSGTIEAVTGTAIVGSTGTGTASTFTIDNSGTITGREGIKLDTFNTALSIENSGTIRATSDFGVAIGVGLGDDDDDDDDDDAVNITNTGSIVSEGEFGRGIIYRGGGDVTITSSGILTSNQNLAIETDRGDDTVNLTSGSATTGDLSGGGGFNTLNFDGSGTLTGNVEFYDEINKTGEGTFTAAGDLSNDGDPFGLNVLGGTLEVAPGAGGASQVTNADVFVTNGATLLVQDGTLLQVNDLDVNSGGHLEIGSGGAGARVDDGTGTTETTAAFSGGASFTVNQNSEFDVRDLEMTDSTGLVAGTATVSNSLTMINSAIHVTSTGIFSALNDIFLDGSTLTVDEGGQITGIDVIQYTGSEVTVNGTQGGSVVLGAGSTLKGKGTILGNAVLLTGATLAPGNSPDTITIGGNLVLNAGTTTEIELTQTQNDRVNVGGTATLGGTLQIIQLEPLAALRASKTFTILDAPNAPIQGTFAAINGTFVRPTISLTAVQNTNNFQLVFTRKLFETFQLSGNQLATGRNLDLYMAGTTTTLDPLVTALDNLTSNQQVSDSLDKLHPEVFDALPQVGFQHAQHLASQVEQYLFSARLNLKNNPIVRGGAAPATTAGKLGAIAPAVATGSMVPDANVNGSGFANKDKRYSGFGYAYSFESDQDTQRNGLGGILRTGSESKDRGIIAGVDKRVNDQTVVGFTFGTGNVDSLFREGRGRTDGDVRQVGAYATCLHGDKYLDAMLAYQTYDFNTLRFVDIPGFLNTLRSHQDMDGLTAYVGGGWMRQSGEWQWGPTASLQWTALDVNGFTESGGIAGLAVGSRDIDSLRSTLGVRATRKFQIGEETQFVPELRLRWSHEFANDDRAIVASFAGSGLPAFTANAASPDRDTVLAGASVNAYFKKDWSAFANYDAELGRDGANVHAARGGFALKF